MGPNGFMGRTLLALQVLFRNVYFIEAFGEMHPKNIKRFPDLMAKSSQLHLSWTHKRCLQLKTIGISQTHT